MPDTITREQRLPKVEVDLETGTVIVEKRARLLDGTTVIGEQVHRETYAPEDTGRDFSVEPAEVQAVAASVRTTAALKRFRDAAAARAAAEEPPVRER